MADTDRTCDLVLDVLKAIRARLDADAGDPVTPVERVPPEAIVRHTPVEARHRRPLPRQVA